ncbi:MAG TPA: LamG-like jellyroll fold domain-containing protein [Candidatus Dormibacteraeota bacterium]|nr:LamG-like jellyroll fold domain-containing protein [Candidatus Dormibacteraeota bacterium]
MTPIVVTGFNRDVVVENTAGSSAPYTAFATNFNAGEQNCFYQTNLPGKTHGLPLTGQFVNTNDGTSFQLQPYTGNNALVFSSDTALTQGALTLTSPAIYSRIAVLANSGNGNATAATNLILHFSDGTTATATYYSPDWFNNSNPALYSIALQGFERINPVTGAVSGTPGNPRLYQTTINVFALVPTNKPLSSITFFKPPGVASSGIYAVSGLPASAVTLASLTNAAASNVLSTSATTGGAVTSTGDEIPVVTIFYGTNNGGTTASAWSNSVSMGYQSGALSQALTGLTPGRTYFFTARAVNAAGTSWATPSRAFSTPLPSPSTITNLPATSVSLFTATLNGQVVTNGGDTPALTLYYGPSDGGNNPAAWAHQIPIGLQNGLFSANVFGLSSNATYFFTASASNFSGISWASPSRSFTTLSTLPPPVAILTQHNDNNRSGENLNEALLNVGNVNTNTFGLVYTRPVDDQIYAQPLIATNVAIPGKGTHNLLIIVTVNDTVYAYDADDPTVILPYWQTNLTGNFNGTNAVAPLNTDLTGACGGNYRDFSGHFGIVGTPVIDPATKIIYLVARTKETSIFGTTFVQRLYALDLTSGTNRIAPVIISGSFGGQTFDPQKNNQRAALTLANGHIFIGWSSHCDWGPYHGWVMAYDAATLAQLAVYCDTPTGGNGGIWMSGQGLCADSSGNVFLSVGNGTVGVSGNASDPTNRAMSFLKLNGSTLNTMSWFTPYNWNTLNGGDWDLGAGGLLMIPGTSLLIGGGKSSSSIPSYLYLVNRDNMGGLTSSSTTNDNIIQNIPVTPTGIGVNHIHGAPVWWDAADGSYLYVWGESDRLHQYKFDKLNGVFFQPAYAQSPTPAWVNGMTGGMLTISANGTNAGTGILWGSHQFTGDANQAVRPGIIHAYDAQNVTNELWNSEQFSSRDSVGLYAKFVPPTVFNSKVYLATFSSRLNVYGLLPASRSLIFQQPQTTTRFAGEPVTISVAAAGSSPLSYQWVFNGTNALPGATNSSLVLNPVQFAHAGTYSCLITNSLGSTNTTAATLTVLTAPTISYVQTVLADQPIAYWRLDETNGTLAHDFRGGHDGQYISATQGQPGYNALDSDFAAAVGPGPDSYIGNIQGIDFSTFDDSATFSVEAWVKGNGTQPGGAGIVTFGYGGGGEEFNLDTGGSGNGFRFSVRDAIRGSASAHSASSSVVASGNWQHVVGVCDEPNGAVRLYVNGASVASTTISGGIEMGTSRISIGSRQADFSSTYTLNFVGSIDEVALYDYPLSAAQVLNHFVTGTNPVVTLAIQESGGNEVLTWTPGTLQSSTNILGPYTDLPGATSPFVVPPTGPQKFFRVRVK